MPDAAAIINRAIAEHHAIHEHIKMAGDTLNDIEGLLTLQQIHASWSQSSIEDLTEKQQRMQQAVAALEKGLERHFGFEEELLLPLFGKILADAIKREHHDISAKIASARAMLDKLDLAGLERRELFAKKSEVQDTISYLCQAVEEHAQHEETILELMKKALRS
jgi:hypothetical protein